jgi:hypothetical protein
VRRLEVEFNRVLSFFFLEVLTLCSVTSFLLINAESAIVLFIFDFLFVSFVFQLTRKLSVKLGLLALGNVVGLFCNFVFYSLNVVGVKYLGEVFSVFYAISFPILNVSWMVTFWSLSLASLPKPTNGKTGD